MVFYSIIWYFRVKVTTRMQHCKDERIICYKLYISENTNFWSNLFLSFNCWKSAGCRFRSGFCWSSWISNYTIEIGMECEVLLLQVPSYGHCYKVYKVISQNFSSFRPLKSNRFGQILDVIPPHCSLIWSYWIDIFICCKRIWTDKNKVRIPSEFY